MNTVLDVEIFAVAVGVVGESGSGHVGHHVEIVTETDILYLPVTANILSNFVTPVTLAYEQALHWRIDMGGREACLYTVN